MHLRRQLDRVADVGVVSAPAGYGKTLLLAEWARATTQVETAWVRLDRDDNPRRLWSAVLAAMAGCRSVPSFSPLQVGPTGSGWDLESAGSPDFLAELVVALDTLPAPLRLVLDDLQEVTDAAALRGVETFLRNRPRKVTLVLASRLDPPFRLHRLRLEGRLTELRADRLRFDLDEAHALLRGAGLDLTAAHVQRLLQQTDGWPAGLRFAAIAVAAATDIETLLTDFSGDDRAIADYLVGEVLSGLSADRMGLLRATSICEALPVGLAVVLSGREDAGWILADLERRTGLVREVGQRRGVYRVQPLLRSYLLADLSRQSVERAARLHATAARWWRGWGRPAKALEHAAQSNDPALLTRLVHASGVSLLVAGEHRPLRRALGASGERLIASDPFLSAVAALVGQATGDAHLVEVAGPPSCHAYPADRRSDDALLRAVSAELGALSRPGGAAAAALPEGDAAGLEPEVAALVGLARCAQRLRAGDDPLAVRRAIDGVLAVATEERFGFLSLQCLVLAAVAAAAGGDLRVMRQKSTEAVVVATVRGWQDSPWALTGTAMLSYAKLLAAEPVEAGRLAAEGLAHSLPTAVRLHTALGVIAGAARADRGDREGGFAAMGRARAALGDATASRFELAGMAAVEFETAVRLGRYVAARTVQRWLVERVGETAEALLMRAELGTTNGAGRIDPARAMLRHILDGQVSAILPSTLVEALLQEATLALRVEDPFAARRALQDAVEVAEPLELLRPFVHTGPAVRELLAQRYGSLEAAHTFGGRALAAGSHVGRPLEAVLTPREIAVLVMLPSLRSMNEIADDMTVSINTLKSHVRSIYTKLGVTSRRSAVLSAHENGLILCSATDPPALPEPAIPRG
ncbi:MAG TPA: LuxR C-terminal-related transcriptional regulator [Pseudonocardia sp.]